MVQMSEVSIQFITQLRLVENPSNCGIAYCRHIELYVVNDVVAYFHENPNIASTRRAYKYFREALAYESAQELSDVKNISHNENADVFALCQSKELFRLKTKKFLLNRDNKRGRFVKCGYKKN